MNRKREAPHIPFDNAPGDVNLIDYVVEIHDAIKQERAPHNPQTDFSEDCALRAGYLLGVEIGRRMAGGAR